MEKGRRADSPFWYARIRLSDNQMVTRSTGVEEKAAAERKAMDIRAALEAKIVRAEPLNVRTFRRVAEPLLADLRAEQARTGDSAVKKHVTTLENCLIPFFGNLDIRTISPEKLEEYVKARVGRSGGAPSKSTIRNHNHTLQKVFARARKLKAIEPHQIVKLPMDNLDEGDPRCTFTAEEFQRLVEFMPDWVADGRKAITREIRAILREYVIICASTGMRPGTELARMTWGQVNPNHKMPDGRTVIVFWILKGQGKTKGKRSCVAFEGNTRMVADSLKRLKVLNPSAGPDTPIFARASDGRVPPDLHGAFETCLRSAALLLNFAGEKRSLYSLRHFYGTQMRLRGHSYERLSKQMGTSLAMLEQYYDHVTPIMEADTLSGLVDPRNPNGLALIPLTADAAKIVSVDGKLKIA